MERPIREIDDVMGTIIVCYSVHMLLKRIKSALSEDSMCDKVSIKEEENHSNIYAKCGKTTIVLDIRSR